ncbi:MAG TPA: tripartite tricarboxylate transporter TctB family protein [Gammaproteobacteria bacterium]|nr:tripartite tricarboxylate transporter TctB family protein [Gammaproteobacteria bacterium]
MFRKADFVLVGTVLALAVASLALGPWLIAEPPIALSRDISPLNPRLFPSIVLVGIIVVAVAFIVNRVRGADAIWDEAESIAADGDAAGLRRLLLFLGLVVICALVLEELGFLTTMLALMVATSVLVGNDNIPQIIGISVGLPLTIYVIVTHFLRTSLPELDILESALAPVLALLPSF